MSGVTSCGICLTFLGSQLWSAPLSQPPSPLSPSLQGKFVTSRNLRERLFRELERNLAMKVEDGETADTFLVSGRGTLHITILIENM